MTNRYAAWLLAVGVLMPGVSSGQPARADPPRTPWETQTCEVSGTTARWCRWNDLQTW